MPPTNGTVPATAMTAIRALESGEAEAVAVAVALKVAVVAFRLAVSLANNRSVLLRLVAPMPMDVELPPVPGMDDAPVDDGVAVDDDNAAVDDAGTTGAEDDPVAPAPVEKDAAPDDAAPEDA